jgi:hypothetical protein
MSVSGGLPKQLLCQASCASAGTQRRQVLVKQCLGGTTEIMKEIIGRDLGL